MSKKGEINPPQILVYSFVVALVVLAFTLYFYFGGEKEDKRINELGGNFDRGFFQRALGGLDGESAEEVANRNNPDANGDGQIDGAFFINPDEDLDGDGVINIDDIDIDGDGILNEKDNDLISLGECVEGESQLCGVGVCQGFMVCSGGNWTDCEGRVEPSEEICDKLDNDCDEEVDEGCSVCIEEDGTIRDCLEENGTQVCVHGYWTECTEVLNDLDLEAERENYEEIISEYTESTLCGDSICTSYETCASCSKDCGNCNYPEQMVLDMEFEGNLDDETGNYYMEYVPVRRYFKGGGDEYVEAPVYVNHGNKKAWDGFSYINLKCSDENSEFCDRDLSRFTIEIDFMLGDGGTLIGLNPDNKGVYSTYYDFDLRDMISVDSSQTTGISVGESGAYFFMKGKSIRGKAPCGNSRTDICKWEWDSRNKEAWHTLTVSYDGKVFALKVDGYLAGWSFYPGYKFNLQNAKIGVGSLSYFDKIKIYNYEKIEIPLCENGFQDEDEAWIDCGGNCGECNGQGLLDVDVDFLTEDRKVFEKGVVNISCYAKSYPKTTGMTTGQLFLNQGDGWFSAQTVSSGRAIPSAGATTDFTTLGLKVSTNAPNKNGAQNPLKVGHVNFKAEDSIPGSWWSGVEPDVDKWGNKYIKKDTYWQVDFTNGPFFVPSIYYVWYCKEAPCDADYPHALVQCKNPYSQEWKTYGKYIIGGETQGEDHHAPTYQVGINSVCDSVRIIKEEIPHTAQGGMPGHGGRPFGLELFNVQLTKLETTFNFELNDLSPGTYEYKCGAFAQTHKSPDFPYYDLSDETRAFTVNWYCKEPNCNYNNESCYSESYIKPDDNTKICRQAGWVNRCGDSFCDSSEECGVCVSDCGICPVEGEPILNFKFEDDFEDGQGLFKLIREHTYGCCTNTDRFVEGVDGKALATETKAFGIDCLYPDSVICKDKLIKYTIEFDILVNKETTASYVYYFSNHRTNSMSNDPSGVSIGFVNDFYSIKNTLFVNAYGSKILYKVPQINKWYHMKATFNEGEMKFYLDDNLIGSKAYKNEGIKLDGFAIATRSKTAAIDNFKIYNNVV